MMEVSVWKTVKHAFQNPSYECFHTQRTYRQEQLAVAVIPRKVADFRDCSANVRPNVCSLLLRSFRIL